MPDEPVRAKGSLDLDSSTSPLHFRRSSPLVPITPSVVVFTYSVAPQNDFTRLLQPRTSASAYGGSLFLLDNPDSSFNSKTHTGEPSGHPANLLSEPCGNT